MPWWWFARADALLNLSDRSWELVRRSRLQMAYIGAESPYGQMPKDISKGTRPDQIADVVKLCRRHGGIPGRSFMVEAAENHEELGSASGWDRVGTEGGNQGGNRE